MKNIFLSLLVILGMTSCNSGQKTIANNDDNKTPSVVDKNGSLSVKGNQIVNKEGKAVSFAGNSFFWSNQGWSGAKFYNKDVVKWLVDDWGATIVRCPLASDKKVMNGYHENPKQNIKRVSYVVDEAIKQGIYVIIDWHSHEAELNKDKAIEFFREMATKYGKHPNVIYEIYNEPLKVSWDDVIKPYAEEVIAEIRKIDPNNLIIVGTPNWSQDVDIASENPITGYKNIAYTLHFYAGSHKQSLREKTEKALNNGIAIMVTEWGTVDADGNGDVDLESTAEWVVFMKKHKLTNCNWAINDKEEGASIILPKSNVRGNWKNSDLTESGKLVRSIIQNWDK